MSDPILVLNCGSSSIKFALFDAGANPPPRKPRWSGKVDGIGAAKAALVEAGAAPTSSANGWCSGASGIAACHAQLALRHRVAAGTPAYAR
jgi:acetate kinase